MEHILTVTETKTDHHHLYLVPIEQWPQSEWNALEDGMRMLADSDALTFVYVLDSDDAFVQLRLPKQVWPALKEAYEKQWNVSVLGPSELPLEHFHTEMAYMLDNIPGNGNYGSLMVEAVEETFDVKA
ncbi:hypothetical protein SAMN05192534_11019 [Alteribacillus persepolensis]|uniref:Uncharacterized protein n=1 Tax=Alteribacillus persepolensis TaxID=568899 RepID=A0A1G8EQ36_9BACI|nr:hypothetical protein [Alteribacillus persepolensis]SDH72020.1 hypothetical protein SAMN05192534_11019 [Alteribacillus persepolensis]